MVMRRFGLLFHGLKDQGTWVGQAYLPIMMVKRMVIAGIVVLLAEHSFGPQAFLAGIQIATLAYLVYFDPFKQVLT
jgi:hypothetical protein